jgi:hypothetical protein
MKSMHMGDIGGEEEGMTYPFLDDGDIFFYINDILNEKSERVDHTYRCLFTRMHPSPNS